jgi:hypothetical protein
MTIVPVLRDRVFEPTDSEARSTALEDICTSLKAPDQAGSARELLAQRTVAIARRGSA